MPNTFTPDNDDYNQTFQPVFTAGYDPYDYVLYIFNRWGQLIFEQAQDTDQFQGKDMKGNEITDGVLFYKLLFQNFEKSGFIHLIR